MITITKHKSWQSLDVVEEILLYYNYTARFVGATEINAPTELTAVYDFVKNIQNALTNSDYYGKAVKPDASWLGLAVGVDYPGNYAELGLSQLYSDAGIKHGFRRCVTAPTDWTNYNDAAYSYGKVQRGDLIGPWIFKDLQDLLYAIRVFKVTDLDRVYYPNTPLINESTHGSVVEPGAYGVTSLPGGTILYTAAGQTTPLVNTDAFYRGHYYFVDNDFSPPNYKWEWAHERFQLMPRPLHHNYTVLPPVVRLFVGYYGRVRAVDADTPFWSVPYGAKSDKTMLLTSQYTSQFFYSTNKVFGGGRISEDVFAARPGPGVGYTEELYYEDPLDPDNNIYRYHIIDSGQGKGAKLQDVAARVEINWYAIGQENK